MEDIPIQNTAEGEGALFALTEGGFNNTAIGFHTLFNVTYASNNTAVGSFVNSLTT